MKKALPSLHLKQQRKLKRLRRIIKQLDESVLVVEGKRDAQALREAGVRKARLVQALGSAENVASRVVKALSRSTRERDRVGDRVVLLTDFDVEGKRRCAELEEALLAESIPVNASLRRDFKRLFRVNCVEHLGFALERLLEETSEKRV